MLLKLSIPVRSLAMRAANQAALARIGSSQPGVKQALKKLSDVILVVEDTRFELVRA